MRGRAAGPVLRSLLPVALALALPFFTPGARGNWPEYGAGWVQRNPGAWDGRWMWIHSFYGPAERTPDRYATIPLESLRGTRRSPGDRIESVQGVVNARRGTLWVTGIDPSMPSKARGFALQVALGLGILAVAAGGWAGWRIRTARRAPWTR